MATRRLREARKPFFFGVVGAAAVENCAGDLGAELVCDGEKRCVAYGGGGGGGMFSAAVSRLYVDTAGD